MGKKFASESPKNSSQNNLFKCRQLGEQRRQMRSGSKRRSIQMHGALEKLSHHQTTLANEKLVVRLIANCHQENVAQSALNGLSAHFRRDKHVVGRSMQSLDDLNDAMSEGDEKFPPKKVFEQQTCWMERASADCTC